MDEFGKLVSSHCPNYDSAESIADSDLEDEHLRKMLASPLFVQEREGDFDSSRKHRVSGKPDAIFVQKREASAQRTQADHSRRESSMSSSSQEHRVSVKPDAMFSLDNEPTLHTFLARNRGNELGDQFEVSVHYVFRCADQSNFWKSLLEGNKEHLHNQARSDLMKQEYQVGSLFTAYQ